MDMSIACLDSWSAGQGFVVLPLSTQRFCREVDFSTECTVWIFAFYNPLCRNRARLRPRSCALVQFVPQQLRTWYLRLHISSRTYLSCTCRPASSPSPSTTPANRTQFRGSMIGQAGRSNAPKFFCNSGNHWACLIHAGFMIRVVEGSFIDWFWLLADPQLGISIPDRLNVRIRFIILYC